MASEAKAKIDAAAEKAYADAAAKGKVDAKAVEKAVDAGEPKAEVKIDAVEKAVKASPAKAASKKVAPRKKVTPKKKVAAAKAPAPAKKSPVKKAAAKKPVAATSAAKPAKVEAKTASTDTSPNPITKIKDTIMAEAKTAEFTQAAKEMAADVQTRMKAAYAKTGEFAGEMNAFNKGNLEAMVESGKIMFAGAQDIVRSDVETGKTAIETMTADVKKMVSVKSPTELMQLQGELARRNFDAAMSFGSKRAETLVKLYNDAFAPISTRMSVAAEKMSKAA